MPRQICLLTIFIIGLCLPLNILAGPSDDASDHENVERKFIQRQATNPVPAIPSLQIQNLFIPNTYEMDGYANQFTLEPIIPFYFEEFPDIVIRPTLPTLVATPDGTFGVGDLQLLQVFLLPPSGPRGSWGVGPAFVFPTASSEKTGQGKMQAGVTAVAFFDRFDPWQFGVVTYNVTSYAGDSSRPDVNTLSVQPIITYHLPKGWYVGWGDLNFTFNWENGGAATLPLSVLGGNVFKIGEQHIDLSFEPFYTPIHDGPAPQWGFNLNWTFLFP